VDFDEASPKKIAYGDDADMDRKLIAMESRLKGDMNAEFNKAMDGIRAHIVAHWKNVEQGLDKLQNEMQKKTEGGGLAALEARIVERIASSEAKLEKEVQKQFDKGYFTKMGEGLQKEIASAKDAQREQLGDFIQTMKDHALSDTSLTQLLKKIEQSEESLLKKVGESEIERKRSAVELKAEIDKTMKDKLQQISQDLRDQNQKISQELQSQIDQLDLSIDQLEERIKEELNNCLSNFRRECGLIIDHHQIHLDKGVISVKEKLDSDIATVKTKIDSHISQVEHSEKMQKQHVDSVLSKMTDMRWQLATSPTC
jgi:hypothetical protein